MLFRRVSFYLAVVGIVAGVMMVKQLRARPPAPPPLNEPARSPFTNSVAASGIIEASRENVKIGVTKAGLVTRVFVQVGTPVKVGEPLFQLDDREAKARLEIARAQIVSLQANLAFEEAQTADMADQFERVARLERDKVASTDEFKRKEFSLKTSQKRVEKAKADIAGAETQVRSAQTELDILTIRAPRDGALLQVNIREGEYAGTPPVEPLMVLGEVARLQVRADVDEQNAPMVLPNQPAVAYLKGSTSNPLALRFVRIEPYVIPKRSLTGDSTERVDTRVLQVIFELDKPQVPLYVGQQVDVFIRRADESSGR